MPDKDKESQEGPEAGRPRKSGIRTMIGDVREYARGKKFSLADLVASAQQRKREATQETGISTKKLYIYATVLFVAVLVSAGGFFWWRASRVMPEEAPVSPPASLIHTDRQNIIVLESENKTKLIDEWKGFFDSALLPREFLYLPILNERANEFLDTKKFFDIAEIEIPPILRSGIGSRSTFGIADTPRGNEAVFVIELTNFSSSFAGLLAWEKDLPNAILDFLKPGLSYERGENDFLDLVVANNDTRFLKNELGEYILGYSVFNRKLLIMAQSPEAIEDVIKQLSLFPPR